MPYYKDIFSVIIWESKVFLGGSIWYRVNWTVYVTRNSVETRSLCIKKKHNEQYSLDEYKSNDIKDIAVNKTQPLPTGGPHLHLDAGTDVKKLRPLGLFALSGSAACSGW